MASLEGIHKISTIAACLIVWANPVVFGPAGFILHGPGGRAEALACGKRE